MAKNLRIAAAALIIHLILFLPSVILRSAMMAADGPFGDDASFSLPSSLVVLFHIIGVVTIIANILWIRGFVLIGEHLKNRLLVVSSYFLFISLTVFNVLNWIPLDSPFDLVAGLIAALFNGVVLAFFGIGILPLRDKIGGMATAYGVLLLIQAPCLALILLAPLAFILEIPTSILGVIVLFRAARLFPFD